MLMVIILMVKQIIGKVAASYLSGQNATLKATVIRKFIEI